MYSVVLILFCLSFSVIDKTNFKISFICLFYSIVFYFYLFIVLIYLNGKQCPYALAWLKNYTDMSVIQIKTNTSNLLENT